jgi:hypothetical protein
MIPGGLPIPLPAPSLACPNARPATGQELRPDFRRRAACVCSVARYRVRARATCTLVELCLHASMGLWGVGGRCGPAREGYVADSPHP